jgi:phosphatidylglycerophosphate synthase
MAPGELLAGCAERSEGEFLLVSGNQVFSPSIIEHLYQLGQNGTEGRPAILRLSPPSGSQVALLAYVRDPATLPTESRDCTGWQELERAGKLVYLAPPAEGYWQALTSPEGCAEAEKKIDRSLYKPTDNVLARLNRRFSIPISRLLVPLGISPNAVTLATLVLSIGSGVAFAESSYAWTLAGGFLAWFSSMLDGSDGEVARLTYRESDFGCWLESVCDHLFYIVVFAGIALGLYRSTQEVLYLHTGLLFQFGAIVSFLVLAHQRKTTTQPGAASSYVVKWRRRLEAKRDNFFYRFALRYGELVRRSTLPYAIFFFALLGDMRLVLLMGTLGANLVWVLSLYSNRLLRPAARQTDEADPWPPR